ncbi:hypothetical protein B0H13DRAFT_2571612 [Mycena leptocephala]|nr:hypothetical protein B0H13DRAFT_2571612 [Mycena leptocephala]
MSPATTEVSYTAADVDVLKPALIDLVKRQIDKWPGGNFKRTDKKITAAHIRKVLLDPSHGFTKQSTEHSSLSNEHNYLRDSRQGSKEQEISQPVNLYVLEPEDEEGNWRADLKDLLRKLQSSNASLTGSYKLAFPDPDHPDYQIYFAKVTSNTPWDEVEPMPPSHIDTGTFDVSDPNAKPLEVARHRTTNVATTSSNNSGINADVEWLTAELKTLPGYSDFNKHRHKVQQNSGVVASWQFLALVSQNYFGKPSHGFVWGIVRYGEGGSNPTQAVIDRIALNEDKPKGAKALYPFLVNWERDHD